jgi:hypothetical protein
MYLLKFLALCALPCAHCAMALAEPLGPGRSQTPSSKDCFIEQPWQFEVGDYPEPRIALLHQGYAPTPHANGEWPLGYDPDPTLLQWVEDLQGGAHFVAAHGCSFGILIEVYPYPEGEDYADSVATHYILEHDYSFDELRVFYPNSRNGWAITLSWEGVTTRCNFNDAIVDFEACCSSVLNTAPVTLNGARVMLVNPCGLLPWESHDNVETFWPCLDGAHTEWGTDGWKYRTARWAKTYDTVYFTLVPLVDRGEFTTLAPYIKWCSVDPYSQIPEQMNIYILADTEVQTVGPTSWAFEMYGYEGPLPPHGPTLEILNTIQNNDTTFTVTVKPITGGPHGTSYLHALWFEIASKNESDIPLDGDGRGDTGPEDWIWPIKHGQDPAASIVAFSVDENGTARFDVERRWHTERFEVWGLRGDEHDVVGASESRAGHHELAVGTSYPLYQLVEIETDGDILDHGVVAPSAQVEVVEEAHPTSEDLYARLDSLFATRAEVSPRNRANIPGNRLDILAAHQFANCAEYHAAYRRWHDGIQVVVVDVSQFGTDPEAIEAGIQSYIAASPSQFFLLVGDAHSRLWTDPTLWSQNGWDEIKEDYLRAGYPPGGDPDRQDIPVGEIPDPPPPDVNMGYYEPYWYKGDGPHYCQSDCPGKVVSRLPFHYEAQYIFYYNKLQWYDFGPVGASPYQTLLCVGNGDIHTGDGSGAFAMSVANDVVSSLPGGTTAYELLLESSYPLPWDRITQTVNRWNSGLDLVYFVSSRSGRYDAGHFLSLGFEFNIDLIRHETWPCWVMGTTCDVGAEFRTMNPDYGETVFLRLLQELDRGAIAGIAAATGTWQSGNKLIAPRATEKIFEDLNRPVMESFRLAQCEVLSELDPVADRDAYDTILSYSLFGDPCLLLHNQFYGTDAPESSKPAYTLELRENRPNPMRESTSIRFGLAHTGPVQMKIYDSAGRLVRILLDAEMVPGQYRIIWRRNTDDGQLAPSGVYFCRMYAGGRELVRKMTVVE